MKKNALFDTLFSSIALPVKPMLAADGAMIRLSEDAAVDEVKEPFFGGYAEDFLADLGFDMVEEVSEKAQKIKRV